MTAFTPSQIPTTGVNAITTLEQLAVWVAQALNNINLTTTAVEGDGTSQRVAQVGDFFVSNNNTYRVITRISVQINPAYGYNGSKLWANAQEISQTALPTTFTS
jgi:hypothetical protein